MIRFSLHQRRRILNSGGVAQAFPLLYRRNMIEDLREDIPLVYAGSQPSSTKHKATIEILDSNT